MRRLSHSLSMEAEHAAEQAKEGAKFTARVAMRLAFLYGSIIILMIGAAFLFRDFELQKEKESAGELRAELDKASAILDKYNLTATELSTVTGVMTSSSDCGWSYKGGNIHMRGKEVTKRK